MKSMLFFICCLPSVLVAGSFSGAVGTVGCEAISKDSAAFVAWANGNLTPVYGAEVEATWKTPAKAYGKATADPYDIVCLGNGGTITMTFPRPIRNGEGPDFAVFENAISAGFLELAFVEVSSDGVNFLRFPNRSEGTFEIGAFGTVDPTTLNGLAGKHEKGYGTPFDLSTLSVSLLLDLENIRYVRIVEIIGNGNTRDSTDHRIYDPTPTTGSGGFDLEAIGVIHQRSASSSKNMLGFSFGALGQATISGTDIALTVPYGTPVTGLAPSYTLAPLATCDKASGSSWDFSVPQTYTVTAEDLSTANYTVRVTLSPASYSQWAADPAQGLAPGAKRGALEDPDADGLSNLLEFALGGKPMVASRAVLPILTRAGGAWLFEYDRSDLALASTVQAVEYSGNLTDWTAVPIPATSSGQVTITERSPDALDHVKVTLPGSGGHFYARLKVTQP
jgi:hypothetical protein